MKWMDRMRYVRRLLPFVGLLLLSFTALPGEAQRGASCPPMVRQALDSVARACDNMGRNSVCYGNTLVEAAFDGADIAFSRPADTSDVELLRTLRTFPLDEAAGLWGVAMMNIQANLPDTLPGQGVKLVLYGDVAIENRAEAGSVYGPMQAFYFTTGAGSVRCNQLPPSSLVIQSPKDITVHLNVNGLDISMGSTVALTATQGQSMRITTLSGQAVTRQEEQTQMIPAGFQAEVELGGEDGLTSVGLVAEPERLDEQEWQPVLDSAGDIFDEPIEFPDTEDYDSWDDFCADPANADLCELPDDLCDEGWCEPICGDFTCDLDEDENSCPADCAFEGDEGESFCGDLICDPDEDANTCAEDCAFDEGEDDFDDAGDIGDSDNGLDDSSFSDGSDE